MGYSRDVYSTVENKLYKLRQIAAEAVLKKKEIFYKRFPRAVEIEQEIALTAINAARAVIEGKNSKKELELLKQKNLRLQNELIVMLEAVNLPRDYLKIKYNCPSCNDEGFIDGIMCECMKKMLKNESYENLNKMSPLKLCTFENFSLDYYSEMPLQNGKQTPKKRMTHIFDFCKKYAYEFHESSPSLLMKGATGLGKTHLSLAIASAAINKSFGVIYGSAQNMISKLERERFQNSGEDAGSERHFIDCDLLIIDDLGTEFSTSFSNAVIYNILNSRIMRNKPTIISTNLSMKEIEESYTERMASRIFGNHVRLEFFGEDIRQKKMKIEEKKHLLGFKKAFK